MAAPFALIFGEGLSEARFLCPSGTRNARFFVLRHRAWGTGGKRQPCGLLRTAQSDPQVRRREASALWAVAHSAKRPAGAPEGSVSPVGCCRQRRQSDPKRGSETMSTTVREVRMIEQPGHLREAQSDPKESTETSGGRGQRSPRRLRLRTCGPPNLSERFF